MADGAGLPGIDPEVALRLMRAGFLVGIVHDRRLMREAQVNIAIRWFAGFGLTDVLPDHSSLIRIRQRWGADRFRAMFVRTVQACISAGIARGEIVHIDATLIRADVSWESPMALKAGAPLAAVLADAGYWTRHSPERLIDCPCCHQAADCASGHCHAELGLENPRQINGSQCVTPLRQVGACTNQLGWPLRFQFVQHRLAPATLELSPPRSLQKL